MKIETRAVHSGDRKKDPASPGAFVPVTTPIYTAASYIYESTAKLDRVLGREEAGYCYSRYDNPTNAALEELMTSLENGHGALAATIDLRRSVSAASRPIWIAVMPDEQARAPWPFSSDVISSSSAALVGLS